MTLLNWSRIRGRPLQFRPTKRDCRSFQCPTNNSGGLKSLKGTALHCALPLPAKNALWFLLLTGKMLGQLRSLIILGRMICQPGRRG
jgi:hypothetical protein